VPPETQGFLGLLAAARAGDHQSFLTLIGPDAGLLRSLAQVYGTGVSRSKVGASDVVQETLLRAWQHFPAFRGASKAEFRNWLSTILMHHKATCLALSRRERPFVGADSAERPEDLIPASTPTPSAEAATADRRLIILSAVAQLKPDFQTVVQLRYVEGLPFDEIAAQMGRSVDAAQKLWTRALAQLRVLLGDKV
jgi:RNA polymerase sigma-70 factor (ECF subfamily)